MTTHSQTSRPGLFAPAAIAALASLTALGAAPAYAAAPPSLTRSVIVERAPHALAGGRVRAGQLFVTIRTSDAVPRKADGVDATAQVLGIGAPARMTRADYSTASGHCYETLPRKRILRHWHRGRQVTVLLALGDGQGHYRHVRQRVTVDPLGWAARQATKRLGCYSSHL